MTVSKDKKSYLDINELVARSGLSQSSIWRLKKAGKIPFFQPGGKGCLVKFPEDAIEIATRCEIPESVHDENETTLPERLSGPLPKWMLSSEYKQK